MTIREPACSKCGKTMERGHVPDVGYGQVLVTRWAPGDPEPKRFLGVDGGIKWDEKEQIPLVAYRCPMCGLVELYALPD